MGQLLPPKSHEQPIPNSGPGWLLEPRLSFRGTRLDHQDWATIECGLYPASRLSLAISLRWYLEPLSFLVPWRVIGTGKQFELWMARAASYATQSHPVLSRVPRIGQLLPPKSHEQPIPDGGPGWLPELLLLLKVNRLGYRSGSRAASLRHISSVEIRLELPYPRYPGLSLKPGRRLEPAPPGLRVCRLISA